MIITRGFCISMTFAGVMLASSATILLDKIVTRSGFYPDLQVLLLNAIVLIAFALTIVIARAIYHDQKIQNQI